MKYYVDTSKNVNGQLETKRALDTNDRDKAIDEALRESQKEEVVLVEVFQFGVERPILTLPLNAKEVR